MIHWQKGLRYQGENKTQRARGLRKAMTEAEKRLWYLLRNRNLSGVKFRRQVPFGPFYFDFYCAEKNLGIELDGGQHFTSEGVAKDKMRDSYIQSKGVKVVHYSDRDMLLFPEQVAEDIFRRVKERESSPPPSPFQGEGVKKIINLKS